MVFAGNWLKLLLVLSSLGSYNTAKYTLNKVLKNSKQKQQQQQQWAQQTETYFLSSWRHSLTLSNYNLVLLDGH